MKRLKNVLALFMVLLLVACSPKNDVTNPSNPDISGTKFISVVELNEMIEKEKDDVVLIGSLSNVKAGLPLTAESSPIPDTLRVWRPDYSGKNSTEAISVNVGGFRTNKEKMEELMSKAGVDEDSIIVTYSTGNMHDGTRIGWQIELLGLDVLYLDGGLDAWKASGYETGENTTLVDEAKKTDFKSNKWLVDEKSATIEDVIEALENPDEYVVIDTRSAEEFDATKSVGGAFGKGQLAGSVHIEWQDALNENKTLKTKAELEEIYGEVIKDKKVITFCQSGVRSAHTQIVLREMLGVKDVLNYDGSWIEWSYAASSASTDVSQDLKDKVLSLTEKWEDNGKEY